MFERKSMRKLSVWWVACLAGMLLLLGMLFSGVRVAYADDLQPGVGLQAVQAEAFAPSSIETQAVGEVYVGNTDVSAGGNFTVDGVACSYDANTHTLTLSGSGTITSKHLSTNNYSSYIDSNIDLNIVVNGVVSLGTVETDCIRAINSADNKNLVISGTGVLKAIGHYYGIYSGGSLIVSDATVFAVARSSSSPRGVYAKGAININSGSISASAMFGSQSFPGIAMQGSSITLGDGVVVYNPDEGTIKPDDETSPSYYRICDKDGNAEKYAVVGVRKNYARFYTSSVDDTGHLEFLYGVPGNLLGEDVSIYTGFDTALYNNNGSYTPWYANRESITNVKFDSSCSGHLAPVSTAYWFHLMTKLTSIEGLSNLNTSNVTNMRNMFRNCPLTSLDLSGFDTSKVATMEEMFDGCNDLETLTLGAKFTSDELTTMKYMFLSCNKLKSLVFPAGFTASKVQAFNSAFSGCRALQTLDLSKFTGAAAKNYWLMFNNCSSLKTLDISGLDTRSATDNNAMGNMFNGCDALMTVKLGAGFSFKSVRYDSSSDWAKLPTPSSASPYTGKWWKEVGGTEYTPVEMQSLTGAAVAGTWTWAQETKTVTFDSNGGSAVASAKVVTGGTVAKPADPTKKGYTFKEWQLNGKAYDFSKPVTSDITLKAAWDAAPAPVAKRTVNFAANGGSGSMASVQVDNGSTYTLPACTFTAPSGKEFDKWDKGAPGAKITVTADTTLTAQWKDAAKPEPKPDPEPEPEPGPDPEPTPTPVAKIEMRRLYNPYSYEHFYTADADEQANLVSLGWVDEGLGWVAPETSDVPVYRLYNPYNGGDHHYTKSAEERDALVAAGWQDEGTGWYSADDDGTPVYREYNPFEVVRNHNYTTDKGEHDGLVAIGWHDEDVAWYGV